jgi:hypothetical protein
VGDHIVTDDTTATALQLADQHAAMLESERDRLVTDMEHLLVTDMEHLRATVERQADRITRQSIAEEQLRVMLMKQEATNAGLARALVQKALPPAPEEKRRTQRWQLWR